MSPTQKRIVLFFIVLASLFALTLVPTIAQTTPESVATAVMAAENANDADAAFALFADDAVVALPTGVLDTPEAILGWQEELAAGHFHLEVAGDIETDGSTVSWAGQIWLDNFRNMGISNLDATWSLVIEDDKVQMFDFSFTPEAFAELQTGIAGLTLIGAQNANDPESAIALFADDAVVTLPTGVFDTPEAIRAWQEELAAGHFHLEAISRIIYGNTIHWEGSVSLDRFRDIGLASLDSVWDIVVVDGKIQTFDFTFTPAAFEALQAASS